MLGVFSCPSLSEFVAVFVGESGVVFCGSDGFVGLCEVSQVFPSTRTKKPEPFHRYDIIDPTPLGAPNAIKPAEYSATYALAERTQQLEHVTIRVESAAPDQPVRCIRQE